MKTTRKFNNGKQSHSSALIANGGLAGATDQTDYFYFFCPCCPNKEVVRILEYGLHAHEQTNEYNEFSKSKAIEGFTLAFKIYCEKCKHTDFFKISNTGWQGGQHSELLQR